jgi:hypothetical protein
MNAISIVMCHVAFSVECQCFAQCWCLQFCDCERISKFHIWKFHEIELVPCSIRNRARRMRACWFTSSFPSCSDPSERSMINRCQHNERRIQTVHHHNQWKRRNKRRTVFKVFKFNNVHRTAFVFMIWFSNWIHAWFTLQNVMHHLNNNSKFAPFDD